MATISRIGAVRAFINDGTSRPTTTPELMQFWAHCSDAEKQEFSDSAAKQMGLELAASVT